MHATVQCLLFGHRRTELCFSQRRVHENTAVVTVLAACVVHANGRQCVGLA